MQGFWNNLVDKFLGGIPNLITALLIFFISLYLARFLSNIVRRVLDKRSAPAGVTNLLAQLTLWTIVVAGTITALQRFFNVTAFLTGLGIVGFTIGFALQDIMKNFAAGVLLLLQQPFHVGETIGVKGFEGTITTIDLRSTEMRANDGRMVILPNAELLVNPIINYSRANKRRVELRLNLPYSSDPDTVRRILAQAARSVPGFVEEPAPSITFDNLTNSAMELGFNFWIDTRKNDTGNAKDAVLVKIKSAFSDEGIELPHPV